MNLTEFYKIVGGDYGSVSERLPSADMIARFVKKFEKDPSYTELQNALAARDYKTAFRAAHTLKGTAANLGFDDLAQATSNATEQLRDSDTAPDELCVSELEKAYNTVIDAIGVLD